MNPKEKAEVIIIVIKRIAKWFLYALAIPILLLLILFGYEKYNSHVTSKPKLITGINGIELNEKLSDMLFKKAGFENKPNENKNIGETYYENSKSGGSFYITSNLVVHAGYLCQDNLEDPRLNNISCGSSGEEITSIYGGDLIVQCSKNKSDKYYTQYRVYDIPKYGVRHHLSSNKVFAFSITTPEKLKGYTGFNWIPCD